MEEPQCNLLTLYLRSGVPSHIFLGHIFSLAKFRRLLIATEKNDIAKLMMNYFWGLKDKNKYLYLSEYEYALKSQFVVAI